MEAGLRRFDLAILASAASASGVPFDQLEPLLARRVALPARLFGCGLRSAADSSAAAFTGTICRVAPLLLDRETRGETRRGFLHTQLADVFGAGSFDDGFETNALLHS